MGGCFQNALLEYQEGDVLKFGSMGWRKKDGSGVWWEFGGEDWTGVSSFIKKIETINKRNNRFILIIKLKKKKNRKLVSKTCD